MTIQRFEDIIAWQKSKKLVILVYRAFSSCKDYSFKNQICRASISVMNNIAEGFERNTDAEFKHFLYILKASVGEVRSMLYISKDLRYMSENEFIDFYKLSLDISRLLSAFIKKLS